MRDMSNPFTRRDALKRLGTAGAGIILGRGIVRGQQADIMVSGKPVEIAVASLSPSTVRITVLPLTDGRAPAVPVDGALMPEAEGHALARNSVREHFGLIHAGNLVVRFTAEPPMVHVETRTGQPVQRLTLDAKAAGMSFLLSQGPMLGLGPGGPQFDRKGTTDRMRSGQGGYNLGTNGGRVPIQWLLGKDGW